MRRICVPCHVCGVDNSIDAFYCGECHSLIRLRVRATTTTQLVAEPTPYESKEMKLLREAYFVTALLMQSAHRLRGMIDNLKDALH